MEAVRAASQSPPQASALPELCISVRRDTAEIARGQLAAFDIQIWSEHWLPAGLITVTLSASSTGGHPEFITRCRKPIRPLKARPSFACVIDAPGRKHADLRARVTAASAAGPVGLTVKAVGPAATLRHPLKVTETVRVLDVDGIGGVPAIAPDDQTAELPPLESAAAPPPPVVGSGQLNTVIAAGNASGLFPAVTSAGAQGLYPAHPRIGTRWPQDVPQGADVMRVRAAYDEPVAHTACLATLALTALVALTPATLRVRRLPPTS